MTPVNDELQQRAIRHQLYLTRLQSYEAAKVRSLLNSAIPDLLVQVQSRIETITARGTDIGPATTKRLRDLSIGLAEMVQPSMTAAHKELSGDLLELASQESTWASGVAKRTIPVQVEMVLPPPALLRALVTSEPIVGFPLQEWFEGLGATTARNVAKSVRLGILEGQTTQQIVQRLRADIFGLAKGQRARGMTRQAEAIARTATSHVSNRARMLTYEANTDIIKGYTWTATLDARTCPQCQALDQQAFLPGGARPPGPPAHVSCRCTLAPLVKSWEDLGIPGLKEMPAGTRASMNGQVPDRTTYNEWLHGRVKAGDMEVVKEALGARRAELFAQGKYSVERFVDRQGRLLTLKELAARDGA